MKDELKLKLLTTLRLNYALTDVALKVGISDRKINKKFRSMRQLITAIHMEDGIREVSRNLGIPQKRWLRVLGIEVPHRGMWVYYGCLKLELSTSLTPAQTLKVMQDLGHPELTKAEGLPNGDVILS